MVPGSPTYVAKQLHQNLREYCDQHGPAPAAFDADGTLWGTDLGEALFLYQIKNHLLPQLPKKPWEHYEYLKENVSHEVAYLWLAQINKGLPLEQIRQWAEKAVAELDPLPIYQEIQETIDLLHQLKCPVYIVTASIKWAVEPGARRVGVPVENVIGVQTQVDQGIISDKAFGAMTYKQGKVIGLKTATKGIPAFFCAGNTEGDLPLLESATHFRLVVTGSPPKNSNYQTEQKMIQIAQKNNWHHCKYY
ncbi:MAG: haloacid dehalogenase-like hydrolase [Bdellovibrionales bacterium]|nr:haloacid dehalogenase-like hydrolase [Bdellovibrionales bacterium]